MTTGLVSRRSTIISTTLKEVGSDTVHLIYEGDPRNPVLIGLTPDGLALRLNTADSAKDGYSAVKNLKGPFDFNGEVNVARVSIILI